MTSDVEQAHAVTQDRKRVMPCVDCGSPHTPYSVVHRYVEHDPFKKHGRSWGSITSRYCKSCFADVVRAAGPRVHEPTMGRR